MQRPRDRNREPRREGTPAPGRDRKVPGRPGSKRPCQLGSHSPLCALASSFVRWRRRVSHFTGVLCGPVTRPATGLAQCPAHSNCFANVRCGCRYYRDKAGLGPRRSRRDAQGAQCEKTSRSRCAGPGPAPEGAACLCPVPLPGPAVRVFPVSTSGRSWRNRGNPHPPDEGGGSSVDLQ